MENKKLELLVIEDDPRHLADAKTAYGRIQEMGSPVEFDYVSTLKDAQEKMDSKMYDGIITDVFFPYDNQTRDDNVEGWDYATSSKCTKLIAPYLPDDNEELVQKHKDWMSGESMHPSGIVVAKEAHGKDIPYVFNSDIKGHGSVMETIFQSAADFEPKYKALISAALEMGNKRKHWLTKYSGIVNQVYLKENNSEKIRLDDIYDGKEFEKATKDYLSVLNKYNCFESMSISDYHMKGHPDYDIGKRRAIVNLYKK